MRRMLEQVKESNMSSLHKLKVADLETIDHLREWVDERLHGSVVVLDTNGEVVIRTGIT